MLPVGVIVCVCSFGATLVVLLGAPVETPVPLNAAVIFKVLLASVPVPLVVLVPLSVTFPEAVTVWVWVLLATLTALPLFLLVVP